MAVAAATQAHAATGCSVAYTVQSQWAGGFTGNVNITNLGDPLSTWTLTWTFSDANQKVTQGWNATYTQSGASVTAASLSYNGALATGATTNTGFNGAWSGANPVPGSFQLNGVTCTGSAGGSPSASPTSTTSPSPSTSPSRTTSPTPTSTSGGGGTHLDNPYAGARGYVNPDWAAEVNSLSGGSRIANVSTAVWLDRIAAVTGGSGVTTNLQGHLDNALAQAGGSPLTVEFVIYDLPNRDCSALASNGELLVANNGLNTYQTQYIDPIAALFANPKYSNLRIVTIIEPDSLPNLITNLSFAKCSEANSTGAYVKGVQYALNKLHAISNVYTYMDAAHSGWLGWDSNFGPAVSLFASTVQGTTAGFASLDGFITNTANYTPATEPFMTADQQINGQPLRSSDFFQWNPYIDEATFDQALYTKAVAAGFPSNIGILLDTSRNGWGGAARPTAASTSTDLNTFVNASRVDRRPGRGDWCNQSGAGLGARPAAAPAAHVDAWVWIKPPGESDGSSSAISNDQGKGFDRMCDPTYGGNALNNNKPSGALPNAPISGAFFPAQLTQLMQNAFPPLQ
jgi:cellulose 1,4-beta-cellobiosidase